MNPVNHLQWPAWRPSPLAIPRLWLSLIRLVSSYLSKAILVPNYNLLIFKYIINLTANIGTEDSDAKQPGVHIHPHTAPKTV